MAPRRFRMAVCPFHEKDTGPAQRFTLPRFKWGPRQFDHFLSGDDVVIVSFKNNAVPIAQTSSSALNAFSSLSSARQQSNNLNTNAQLLDQQANQAILNAGQQSALIRRRGAQFQGDQDARIAASGTGFGGTNALLRRQTALNIQEDANAVANEGILQSDALKNQASATRSQAKAARPGLLGYLGAGTSVASTFLGAKYGKKT